MQDRLSFKQQNLSVGQHFSIAGHQAKTIHQLLERVQASLSINGYCHPNIKIQGKIILGGYLLFT